MGDEGVDAAIRNELLLHQTEVRRSPDRVAELLDPEFVEFGASGRRWNRAETLAAIATPELTDDVVTVATEITGARLAENVVLITYVSERPERRARRSSLWRRAADGVWRMYFHQGTVIPDARLC